MIRLMNSAMMPIDGTYTRRKIDRANMRAIFESNKKAGWESYIGYPNTASMLSSILGVEVPVSRKETSLEDGDVIIVAKLRYRVNPSEKSGGTHGESEDDYEFFQVTYRSEVPHPLQKSKK